MNKRLTRISKYMSFILCHEPKSIGLKLDTDGWANVDEFVEKANASGKSVTTEQVMTVVAENDKQRFELSEDKSKIRAVQISRKAIRQQTRQAAAKPATPKPKKPAAKTIFTRSKIVQRTETD
ncbi:RNA 2'-phosphotransferase [Rubripirellula obstinata]|uniref:RNA 2'-phosphotransferase n=1 Tax=Rubripirellula obstinata TaxID=406547 RepID=A0A5B1C9S1_9BACT|nr:RNA 2'-phosphotransferase [Rubripirellula obstinata]KAA1257888.1 RNA 2'-phosphotransferase [Rubripirellula obstinata]